MLLHKLFLTCLPPILLAACALTGDAPAVAAPTLRPYTSEAELTQALERWRSEGSQRRKGRAEAAFAIDSAALSAAAPAVQERRVDASPAPGSANASITNVQTAGVDEGGIVKRAGDHLVILRRGRLFTVRIGADALQPVASIDAYAPGSDASGAWYDELLIAGTTIVVVGYSYARGGTEIGLFEIDGTGTLAYRATYHLRSFDYYSSRNYASRLIGRTLVFYTPTLLQPWGPSPSTMMPALRRWHPAAAPADFERILPATRIYRTDDDFDPSQPLALHTVTQCRLGGPSMPCESTAVLGPAGRVFYVSQGSVYVWTAPWTRYRMAAQPGSAVFRIPLDGSAPTGLKTAGVPIDQLSFLEGSDGHLNVLLRQLGAGEGMWGSERTAGSMALLRVPLAHFGDGRGSAEREHYRVLPAVRGGAVHNRFVGDWLLFGSVDNAWAMRYASDAAATPLDPGHSIERIEAMGSHALLAGNAGADLHFSSVRLARSHASLAGRHVQPAARQGETRTHGFFFKPTGTDSGWLGLPLLGTAHRRAGVYMGNHGAASVLFLRQRDLAFSALGELRSSAGLPRDDGCKASCVDWYGNARPLFIGERVFALLGYELVEARVGNDLDARIEERRRIDFAPVRASSIGRYTPFQ